jgi:hypothetical protein
MTENQSKNDIIDTTDSLEVVNAFNSMKNFLFIVILICLILVQAIFWVNNSGLVSKETCSSKAAAQPEETVDLPKEEIVPPVLDKEVKDKVEKDAGEVTGKPATDEEKTEATVVKEGVAAVEEPVKKGPSIPLPKACCLSVVIKICNFILVIAATLYSLTLLMSIKISLCGRLGGISHISKAFFASLFALVILMPWQALLPGILVGAIYTPAELFNSSVCPGLPGVIVDMIYYLRFSAMWLVVVLLLISSWIRSRKWSRTILKRLGILH